VYDVLALHQKYGDAVRIGPEELSFTDPGAWNDIYSRKPGRGEHEELPKHMVFTQLFPDLPTSILTSDTEEHSVLRKGLSPSFSEKGMRSQEHLIKKYVDLLIQKLGARSTASIGGPQALDMTGWYNWTTFDIIGELTFAEPWGCLESAEWHPWVKGFVESMRYVSNMETLLYLGFSYLALAAMIPAAKGQIEHQKVTRMKLDKRMAMETEREDLVEVMLKNREKWVLPLSPPPMRWLLLRKC
jgi:cytochrome P450